MSIDRKRRALIAAVLGGSVGAATLTPAKSFLDRFAPLSGSVWSSARRDISGSVESPHGAATVRYDDHHVPHVTGDNERALAYAAGYVQANDRLFQMDVLRRRLRGRLSELAGPSTVETDRFNRKMDFAGAAEVTWQGIEGTEAGDAMEAYAEGVNAFIDNERLPFEFALAEYEPEPWEAADILLNEKQIAWGLTGSFRTLRKELVRRTYGADTAERLYPRQMDHDTPILRDGIGGQTGGVGGGGSGRIGAPTTAGRDRDGNAGPDRDGGIGPDRDAGIGPELVSWLSGFESPPSIGSNSWMVSGEHTASGAPILANDPHLVLTSPPVWYEMHLQTDEMNVRGVTFPGIPLVIIGRNEHGAWGITNANADVVDFYEYDLVDGGYRYRGETREFQTREETIEVSGGDNEEVTVKKSVHGPVLERSGYHVGIAWTGFAATETTLAVRKMARSEGVDEFEAAMEQFDLPTQNMIYADSDGNTLYYLTGRIPVREVDGEEVAGDRIFDGSAGEAEWSGYTPYGESSWEGFVPFDEKPHVRNPEYLATANQRIADDPVHYIAEGYSDPFRGIRIYDLLEERVESDEPVTPEYMKEVQRDVRDGRAVMLVDEILDARDLMGERAAELATELEGWDYRMRTDSRAALVFSRWYDHFRDAAFGDDFQTVARLARGSDPDDDEDGASMNVGRSEVVDFYPNDWITATLPEDSEFFEGARSAVIADAMETTAEELDDESWDTYGDYSTSDYAHPLGSQLDFLNYPAHPVPGSGDTVMNNHVGDDAGSSWRMIVDMADDGEGFGIIPGGNSGDYFSEHYDDQLEPWASGEYKRFDLEVTGDVRIEFE